MCDCYDEPCKMCGDIVPMHLGDYRTHRTEIAVLCPACTVEIDKFYVYTEIDKGDWIDKVPFTIWNYDDGKGGLESVMILLLTDNARSRYEQNHPNISKCELFFESWETEEEYPEEDPE